MTKTTKIVSLILVVLVIIIILVRGAETKKPLTTNDPIKIGVVYSLTGGASTWSEYAKQAADLAVKEVNDQGGINGQSIKLLYEDAKTTPAQAVSAFQKLTDVDKVTAVVGDVWAFVTNPMIPLSQAKRVVLISPTVMDKSVEGSSDYFFSLGHTIQSQEGAVKKFFDRNPDVKTVSIICWDDPWGQADLTMWKGILVEKKIKILSEDCSADYSIDYRTEMAKIKAANPDALILGSSSGVIKVALQRIAEFKIKAKILGTSTIVEALEGQSFTQDTLQNIWFTNWEPSAEFVRKFQGVYGKYPIVEAQNSYETIRSLALALKNNPANLLDGLKSVRYTSTDGVIDFTQGDHITVNQAQAILYKVTAVGYEKVD